MLLSLAPPQQEHRSRLIIGLSPLLTFFINLFQSFGHGHEEKNVEENVPLP